MSGNDWQRIQPVSGCHIHLLLPPGETKAFGVQQPVFAGSAEGGFWLPMKALRPSCQTTGALP